MRFAGYAAVFDRPDRGGDVVKAFLRLATSDEDALLAGFVRSASTACETFIGLALVAREVRETVAPGAWRRLGTAPVQAIETVSALSVDGAETAMPADSYRIDIDAAGEGWVRVPSAEGRARVRYTAGLAVDWNGLPEPLRQGSCGSPRISMRPEAKRTRRRLPASPRCGGRGAGCGSADVRPVDCARGATGRAERDRAARTIGRAHRGTGAKWRAGERGRGAGRARRAWAHPPVRARRPVALAGCGGGR